MVELLKKGYHVVVVDNLSNSSHIALERIKKITAKDDLIFEQADMNSFATLD